MTKKHKSTKKNTYPEWVEIYRTKGHTIRKVRNGYGLYSCTSVYVKGSYPKSVQTYLGMITEKDGFIPKKVISSTPSYVEYGLSHLIWINFKRSLMRSFNNSTGLEDIVVLGIIHYIFGSVDPCYIRSSYISHGKEDALIVRAEAISLSRIKTVSNKIEKLLKERIPDKQERDMLTQLLPLAVVDALNESRKPQISSELSDIIERTGLKYE